MWHLKGWRGCWECRNGPCRLSGWTCWGNSGESLRFEAQTKRRMAHCRVKSIGVFFSSRYPLTKQKPWLHTRMFPLESTFRRLPYAVSITKPLKGRRATWLAVIEKSDFKLANHDGSMLLAWPNAPRGEARVIRVPQNLMRVADRHHPVPYQLKAQALIVRRLVH